MAIKFNRSQTFATNGTVTAAALHNLIDGTDIYQALITDQTAMTSVGSLDKLLIADSDLTAGDAPRSVTVNELFEDALTLSTYTNIKATNAAITAGTIATGTIATGTFGTTTSTAATITTGTITNLNSTTGTVATLNSTTGTITNLNSTTGTVATLNSTTGTIPTLTSITKITSGTGTAAAPAISPTGDTNTGIFFPVADTVAFAEGGTEAMRIDSSGNVGIGVTSPSTKLDVDGALTLRAVGGEGGQLTFLNTGNASTGLTIDVSTANVGRIFSSNNNSSLQIGQFAGTGGVINFYTSGTERLRIASNGQIGIGGANYGTSGQVLTSGGASAAPSWQTASGISIGTAVASTSGTAIDFTGIPSGVKKVTVMLNGVSTSGVSNILFQLGTSGGVESTEYSAASTRFGITALASANYNNGFGLNLSTSTETYSGSIIISSFGSNTWTAQGVFAFPSGSTYTFITSGVKTLSSVLDRVRITSATPDTFDAGTVNILYES